LVAGTGTTPTLFNEGTVRKDEGSGMAFVEFKTNNESLVKAESGNLTFDGGGGSGAEQKDKWVAEGEEAELNFSGALFTLGDLSEMRGPIYLLKSAIVKEEHHECPVERNEQQDKKVTDRELEEAGLDAHELKEGRKGTDIYKDRAGNLYEKPHGGRGPGEPLGINIRNHL
jgi:hypothetical protein